MSWSGPNVVPGSLVRVFSRTTDPGHWSGLVPFTYTNPDLVREITRVISRCEHKLSVCQGHLYIPERVSLPRGGQTPHYNVLPCLKITHSKDFLPQKIPPNRRYLFKFIHTFHLFLSLQHSFLNMGKIGHSFEKMSADQRVSPRHSVPCRQVYCTLTAPHLPCYIMTSGINRYSHMYNVKVNHMITEGSRPSICSGPCFIRPTRRETTLVIRSLLIIQNYPGKKRVLKSQPLKGVSFQLALN